MTPVKQRPGLWRVEAKLHLLQAFQSLKPRAVEQKPDIFEAETMPL